MKKMLFSYSDYQKRINNGERMHPRLSGPLYRIDPIKYNILTRQQEDQENTTKRAFTALRTRCGINYYGKIYPIQHKSMRFSKKAFPAYKFILPELLNNDWLAIVDWHKFHRDHSLHMPLTAYIIYRLLGGGDYKKALKIGSSNLLDLGVNKILNDPKAKYIKDYLINLGFDTTDDNNKRVLNAITPTIFWRKYYYKVCILAALFHDIGYPWQYIKILNDNLNNIDLPLGIAVDQNASALLVNSERMLFCPFNGYVINRWNKPFKSSKRTNQILINSLVNTHGLPGAFAYLLLHDSVREYPTTSNDPLNQFAVEWASLGILMHDMKKIYFGNSVRGVAPENSHFRLEFNKDPLSCIVTLADFLEEFERPNAFFSRKGKKNSEIKYKQACISSKIEIINNKMIITFIFKNRNDINIKYKKLSDDLYDYFDPQYGYLDFSSIGIHIVKVRLRMKK